MWRPGNQVVGLVLGERPTRPPGPQVGPGAGLHMPEVTAAGEERLRRLGR